MLKLAGNYEASQFLWGEKIPNNMLFEMKFAIMSMTHEIRFGVVNGGTGCVGYVCVRITTRICLFEMTIFQFLYPI